MATEKILNTRIGLKIDTLENWSKSTLALKPGEVAFATVAATAGTGLTEPVVMMKIGEDGVKTFNDIEYNFYAKASDVLAACKSEEGLKAFVNGVIADAGIASNDAMEALAGRVTDTETAITTLNGDAETAGSVAKAIKDAIDALDLANTYVAIEEGKSLVSDTEIARLAAMKDGANKVEASETNGSIKIDGVETVVYTHPEKHTIDDVTGLQDALDGKQAAGDYAAEVHTHTKEDITDFEHTHVAADVTDLDDTIKAYDYATKTEAQGYADAKDEAIAAAKKAGDDAAAALNTYKGEMTTALAGKQDVIPENTYDAHGAAAQALVDAKAYTDEEIGKIPAQVDYTVTITETTDGLASDVAKKYTFTQNGAEIGSINLAKELVVNGGSVKEVTEADAPYTGAKVGDKYIELLIANQDTPIYVPAKDLVDIYTAKELTTESTDEVKIAISNTNEISATLVDGKVAKSKLAADVQASLAKADSALQEHQDISHLATTEALNSAKDELSAAIETAKTDAANQATVVLAEAQKYADGKASDLDGRVQTLEAIDHDAYKAADTELKNELEGKINAIDNHSHANKTVLDGITAEKVTAWDAAEQNAKDYADGKVTDLADGQVKANADAIDAINNTETGILAQAKAYSDSLNHEDTKYTAAADGGLKLDENNAFSIDDSIVFVFDCGGSGVAE